MSGSAQPPNALMPPPSLEQEIRRLIAIHGADAVKREIAAATKARRGAPPKKDGLLLRPYLEADANDWLEGRNPFEMRTNNANACKADAANPDPHTQPNSQWRRLMRWQERWRERIMLYSALKLAEDSYPYPAYFRVLEELAKSPEMDGLWPRALELDREILARYREVYGEPPSDITWVELKAKPRSISLASLLPTPQ